MKKVGNLTEAVRRKPYTVILLDEIEKAHPEVFNILLQMLDDGRITDSQGRTVDFKNTVIIMTSNIGSHDLLEGNQNGKEINEEVKDLVISQLRQHFKPEFLNRVDDIVLFKPLSTEDVKGIVVKLVKELQERLNEQNIKLEITEEASQFISDSAYDPVYGARPLKRFLQRQIETKLAREIISGKIEPFNTITVSAENGELVLKQI